MRSRYALISHEIAGRSAPEHSPTTPKKQEGADVDVEHELQGVLDTQINEHPVLTSPLHGTLHPLPPLL